MLESLFNKVAGLGLQLYKKETSTQVLSCVGTSANFCFLNFPHGTYMMDMIKDL